MRHESVVYECDHCGVSAPGVVWTPPEGGQAQFSLPTGWFKAAIRYRITDTSPPVNFNDYYCSPDCIAEGTEKNVAALDE